MKKLQAYLFFNGKCREAMSFYKRTLGGKLSVMTVKESPRATDFPSGSGDRILHARLSSASMLLMASDWMSSTKYSGMSGFNICLTCATRAEAKSVFLKLSKGGKVTCPFGKTFYSEGFGMFSDRFGTPWMILTGSKQKR